MVSTTAAPVPRRIAAAFIDGLLISLLGGGFWYLSLMTGGLALPMLAGVGAIFVIIILPTSAFGASPGKALMGLEVIHEEGRAADASELIFRELVGRGLIGVAYFATVLMGLAGYLTGMLQLFIPQGIGLVAFGIAGLLFALGLISHIVALADQSGRGLHDRITHTLVQIRPENPPEDPDEDLRAFHQSARRARVRRFFIGQTLVVGVVAGLPFYLSRPDAPSLSLQDRVELKEAKANFEADPSDRQHFGAYARLLRHHQDDTTLTEVQTRHKNALEDRAKNPLKYDKLSQIYREQRATAPCDFELAIKAAERFNAIGAHVEATQLVESTLDQCGPNQRLRWPAVTGYRKLGNYSQAVNHNTALILGRPDDADYWWWRGEDHAQLGQKELATADYWTSMAVDVNGFAADHLYDLWAQADRCEAVRALTYYLGHHSDEDPQWASDQLEQLGAASQCWGRGTARYRFPKKGDPIAPFRIGGTPARLLWAPTGYLTVSRAFAQKAGLTAQEPIFARVLGAPASAQLTRADVGYQDSQAPLVRIAIVEEAPPGIDGWVGLSFLSFFNITPTEGGDGYVLAGHP